MSLLARTGGRPLGEAPRRLVLASAFLLVLGCRPKERPEPPPSTPDVVVPIPLVEDAAPPAPAVADPSLPAAERLRAPFRGTLADGFVAATAVGASRAVRIVAPLRAGATVDEDRPVAVASFTKLWVAIAVLRLVERNELSLDATIAELLPPLASRPWADSTLRELLTHTSRVPELDDRGGFYARQDVDFSRPTETLGRYIPRGVTEKRGVYKYRNAEAALAGAILQARAGIEAARVLEREVFEPAGMTHAGLLGAEPVADLDLRPVGTLRPQNFFTAGAGYASPRDLLAFFEALSGTDLLTEKSKATLFDGAPARGYGALGCWVYPFARGDAGTTPVVERTGAFANVRLYAAFFPEARRAVVAWSREPVEIHHPRVARSIGSTLARIVLEELR